MRGAQPRLPDGVPSYSGVSSFAGDWGVALVVESPRRCALPGCEELLEDIPGRPPRRYCSAAHRAAARQARRAAAQQEQDARLAATLPWLAEPLDEQLGHAPRRP